MTFKAKLFKLGNSRAVYIPKEVYTDLEDGKVYTFEVRENGKDIKGIDLDIDVEKIKKLNKVHPPDKERFNTAWCSKHSVFKGSCGCK